MILRELVLHNFGVFCGRQTVNLTPPSTSKPIILFGGLNGSGKTTFMDALQLALYGKLAKCSNRGSLAYEEYLRRCIHRGTPHHEGAAVELEFSIVSEGRDHIYRVHRSWSGQGEGCRERVEVWRDGLLDRVLTESWNEHVEVFIPSGVSQLFFFDGEKIEGLADLENSSKFLSTAIRALLGVDLVDRLVDDLQVLGRRKQLDQRPNEERARIEELRLAAATSDERYQQCLQEQAAAQNELDRGEKVVQEAEANLRRAGGDVFQERTQLERKRLELGTRLQELEAEMRDLAAGPAPLLLVMDQLAGVEARAERELEAANSESLVAELEARDRQVCDLIAKQSGSEQLTSAICAFLDGDRRARRDGARVERILAIDEGTLETIRALGSAILPDLRERIARLLAKHEELESDACGVDRKLTSIPDEDTLAELTRALLSAQAGREHARRTLATAEEVTRGARHEREVTSRAFAAELEGLASSQLEEEDVTRVLRHTTQVRSTLSHFRARVIERHVRRIEALVLDSFRQLLRKQTLVCGLTIDPQSFALELRNERAQPISPDRLSAGERQLLAVSLLWGLSRASGYALPTVVDTPLGRLDASHRRHLVERYFPVASHQVILFSTDEEIREPLYREIQRACQREYTLSFDGETASSEVRAGYSLAVAEA